MNSIWNRSSRRSYLVPGMAWMMAFCLGCEKVPETAVSTVVPDVIKTPTGIEMVALPAGTFLMGKDRGAAEEGPAHSVTIDALLMDRYEVTQEEYEKFVIGNPSKSKDPKNPIERVPWSDAALYCNARSSAEGLEPCYNEETFDCNFQASGYRLPTEAEWEYACRAGSQGDYSFGSTGRQLGDYAWFKDNSAESTHHVGMKKPNAWGLYDMYGNVGEWCQDIYDGTFYERPAEPNPCSITGGPARTLRGGSWSSPADRCRSTSRSGEAPGSPTDSCFARPDIGFRCVRRAPAAIAEAPAATEGQPASP